MKSLIDENEIEKSENEVYDASNENPPVGADYNSLSYSDWDTWAKILHGGPPSTVGVNAVLHLITEDIYLDIQFTSWSSAGGGGFAYERSTPSVVPEPGAGLLLLGGLAAVAGVRGLKRRNVEVAVPR